MITPIGNLREAVVAKTEGIAPVGSKELLGAVVEFVKGKLAAAEHAVKCREEAEKTWRGGTDESWRAVGCRMALGQRMETSAREGRIAIKCRREVEMFKEVLARLQAPNVKSCGGGEEK
jgi:hypothetical protein